MPQPVTPNTAPQAPAPVVQPLPTTPNLPPRPTYQPNVLPSPLGVNSAPAPQNTAPTAEQLRQFERRAENRGLLTGLLVGGTIEHIRHRRKQKKLEKALKKQGKELADTQTQQTELEKRISQYKQSAANTAQSVSERVQKLTNREQYLSKRAAEQQSKLETLLAEQKLTTTEKPASTTPEVPEQAEVPQDRRVEASSWHRIEIDKRTGKPVEAPALAYGSEFQHEQQQEQAGAYRDLRDAGGQQGGGAGGDSQKPSDDTMQLPTPGGQPQDAPEAASKSSLKSVNFSGKDNNPEQATPIMWGVLAVIVTAIVFLLFA